MFNLAPTLRALTAGSPLIMALYEARRMAQQYRERGGAAVSAKAGAAGFGVPPEVDVVALVAAIEATLRAGSGAGSDRSSAPLNLLERRSDGQLVVSRIVLERLGTGDAACGEKVLQHLE